MSDRVELVPGWQNNVRFDLPAGLVVFLVALPLCLGIALASGAPLFGGVIAGVVGGIVVGLLSGSEVSVAGPAAGLAVIVAAAIERIGSYPAFLVAVVLGGGIQILLGLLRLGVIGNYVPNSVIKGMLAAIGIVIVLKQIPHALGRDKDFEGDFAFLEQTGSNTLTEIANAFASASPAAIWISAVSLLILLTWDTPWVRQIRILRPIPAPLLVVATGIGLNELFRWLAPGFELSDPEHLVRLPVSASIGEFWRQFVTPDWSAINQQQTWITAATLAAVASIESLLSVEAADKLDPFKRITPTSRELVAQGIGNALSGLIGGLPVTSVVVRTSANVYAGARTKASAITHGFLLLFSALLIPALLNRTPLACLAAILLVVGYRLAKPALFQNMWRQGLPQFVPFLVTVLAIVFTDLLTGVLIGLTVGVFFVMRGNNHEAVIMVNQDHYYLIRFNKDATFVNKSVFKKYLRSIPDHAYLIIDATKAIYIDNDIFEVAAEFRQQAFFRNITVEFKNFFRDGKKLEDFVLSAAH